MDTTLGLDLGTNSIGWALVGHAEDGTPARVLDAGVRIFSAGVNDKDGTPLNLERRGKRLLRRQIRRRRQRRDRVRNLLIRENFLPVAVAMEPQAEGVWNSLGDVYALRTKGLDQPLTAHEFGRVMMHLQRHRGFQSNRRADRKAKDDKEKTDTDHGIADLRAKIQADGARTLGEWLLRQPQQRNSGQRLYYTERAMLREEFAALYHAQIPHHPRLDDADFEGDLHEAIFFQRPLKSQAGLKGGCSLEPPKVITVPAETRRPNGQKRTEPERLEIPWPRASMAWQECQRARYWQDLNHLTLRDPTTGLSSSLSLPERQALAKELETVAKLSWTQVRKIVGKKRGGRALHSGETFNLEDGGKDALLGNRTAVTLRKHLEGTPVEWEALPPGNAARQVVGERSQAALIKDLITIDQEEALAKRLQNFWGLSQVDAGRLAKNLRVEEAPGRLSLKAIGKILPHLEQGLNYHDACQAAGYERRDQQTHTASTRLMAPPEVRNPVVAKGLYETRKVVNALIAAQAQALRSLLRRAARSTGLQPGVGLRPKVLRALL